jgi:urea transport system permease protein
MSNLRDRLQLSVDGLRWYSRRYALATILVVGFIFVPALYLTGMISIETVNMLGRYLCFSMVAVSLDLAWGYTGMLCLCQSLFFALGGYCMGMYLAHHGGPEGIIDATGWKLPACLYVVYPYEVGEDPSDALLPWFWKPFWTLPATVVLGLIIPAVLAFVVGFFVFKSRVQGVFFAILTQAFTLAAGLVFCMNDMKLCGTNGLTRFDKIIGFTLSEADVKLSLYLLTLLMLVAVFWLCRKIIDSRFGRVLIAIRDNETRLRFSGYKPYHFKAVIFALSAMIAGLAGLLYAPQMGIFTPAKMEVKESILVVIWVAVGGRGTLSGAILGSLVVNLLYNYFTSGREFFWFAKDLFTGTEGIFSEQFYTTYLVWKPDYWPFALGALFVGVVIYFPDGLLSAWNQLIEKKEQKTNDEQSTTSPGNESEHISTQERLRRVASNRRTRPEKSMNSHLDSDLLRIENLQVVFDGFKALDIKSFNIQHYGLHVVIGPNGAGKTTLCDVISGKTRPTTGRVFFEGVDVTSVSEADIARLGVGRKFQTPTVFDSLTVYENMELVLPNRQSLLRNFKARATPAENENILKILKRVKLAVHADKQVKHLSHGQRQWLEISMLILAGPQLLLVDEPAAGLTTDETVLTAELLMELQAEHAIIVIEHDMDFVRLLNSPVTVLNAGEIMDQGSMTEIQENPEVIEAYLGR